MNVSMEYVHHQRNVTEPSLSTAKMLSLRESLEDEMTRNSALDDALTEARTIVEDLQKDIASKEKITQEHDDHVRRLKEENELLLEKQVSENEEHSKILEDLQERIAKDSAEIERLNAVSSDPPQKPSAFAAHANLIESGPEMERLQTENASLLEVKARHEIIMAKLGVPDADLDSIVEIIEKMITKTRGDSDGDGVDVLKAALAESRIRVAELEKSTAMTHVGGEKSSDDAELRNRLEQSEALNTSLKEQMMEVRQQYEALVMAKDSNEGDELRQRLLQADKLNSKLTEQLMEIQEQMQALVEAGDGDGCLASLQNDNQDLKEQIDALRQAVENRHEDGGVERLKALQEVNQDLVEQLEALRQAKRGDCGISHGDDNAQLKALQAANQDLMEQLQALREAQERIEHERQYLVKELQSVSNQHHRHHQQSSDTVHALKKSQQQVCLFNDYGITWSSIQFSLGIG